MRDTPSVFTPLFRRLFTNERERELDETRQLYDWVRQCHEALADTPDALWDRVCEYYEIAPYDVRVELGAAALKLIHAEEQMWELPPPDFHKMTEQQYVEFRNLLCAKQHFYANRDEAIRLLFEGIVRTTYPLIEELPDTESPSPFTIPLAYTLSDPYQRVSEIIGTLWEKDYQELAVFKPVTRRLYLNVCEVSGRDPYDTNSRKEFKNPKDLKLPVGEMVETFLKGTPYQKILEAPVPLKLTYEDRYSHWWCLAGAGQGKTVMIENLIRHDLASDDPPSIVLIDPHSDLVRKLVRSDLGIEDRLLYIDPRDSVKHPIAMNPFAVSRARMESYDETTREQVTAGVIQTFGYLFNGLTNLPLTGKQEVFFKYVTRLMLMLPEVEGRNATIQDMLQLMRNPEPYRDVIKALPEIPREFFEQDFMSKTYEQTKEQVRYRLQGQIENPTLARLFSSSDTIDFYSELNRGAVILVDTAKDFLKEGSAVFGKLVISLILQAVMERAAISEYQRKPTFLIVDEAGSFFSSNIDDLLTEARKFKCGCLFAHQYIDQATPSLRASLAANTSIKFAGGLSAQDAGTMARELRTTPEFILDQPKLQFAAHIRGVTKTAITIPVHPVRSPTYLTQEAIDRLIADSRKRVAIVPKSEPPPMRTYTRAEVDRIMEESRRAAAAGESLSEEFYELLRASLDDGGVLVVEPEERGKEPPPQDDDDGTFFEPEE